MQKDNRQRVIDSFIDNPFKQYFVKMIELRIAQGDKMGTSSIYTFRKINDSLSLFNTDHLTRGMVDRVFREDMDDNGLIHHQTFSHMRTFSLFMAMYIGDTFIVPPGYWGTRKGRTRTFVFTDAELARIVHVLDDYCARSLRLQRLYDRCVPHPVIVRMLIGTGMRISEVLSLRWEDLDIENGIIKVINGKDGVSRLIPVSSSLMEVLKSYTENIDVCAGKGFVFPSPVHDEHSLTVSAFEETMKGIFWKAGIVAHANEFPVIHSFRHTFITKSLERLIRNGMDEHTAIQLVAAYAGHTQLHVTYHYLHLSEEIMERFNNSQEEFEHLIPEACEEMAYEW